MLRSVRAPLTLAAAAAAAAAAALQPCVPKGAWAGPCVWPNAPPADCPFERSAELTDVSFSGVFGSYPGTTADTWYHFALPDGRIFTTFADGGACPSSPPSPPPVPPGLVELLWWWSESASDNVLTTAAYPPEGANSSYEFVGVIGYAQAGAAAGPELKLWRASNETREYFTTSGKADEDRAASLGYALVAALGASLPLAAPPDPDPATIPPTTSTNMPNGEGFGYTSTTLYFSPSRREHYSTPEAFAPGGYSLLSAQGAMLIAPGGAKCEGASGVSDAQGFTILSGSSAFNLTVDSVGLVAHPRLNVTLTVPPPYGVYPSTVLAFKDDQQDAVLAYGYYLLADPNGDGCSNWCHQGPLLAFAVSSDGGASWSYQNAPLWDGENVPRGVFEDVNVSKPIRMGVPRFADLGPNLKHSPDGRAYLLGKGCDSNDGTHCSFMTGDSAFLARTRLPFAELVAANNVSALNLAESWEFSVGGGQWAPTLDEAQPLFAWPTGVGGLTLTYDAPLGKFLIVSNLPSDRIHPTDCAFDTYLLESSTIDAVYKLVSYMPALGPQMYFQQISSSFWSSDGLIGAMFSSGNWDGSCTTQGSNPPGERYGLVTTEFSLVAAKPPITNAWTPNFEHLGAWTGPNLEASPLFFHGRLLLMMSQMGEFYPGGAHSFFCVFEGTTGEALSCPQSSSGHAFCSAIVAPADPTTSPPTNETIWVFCSAWDRANSTECEHPGWGCGACADPGGGCYVATFSCAADSVENCGEWQFTRALTLPGTATVPNVGVGLVPRNTPPAGDLPQHQAFMGK